MNARHKYVKNIDKSKFNLALFYLNECALTFQEYSKIFITDTTI